MKSPPRELELKLELTSVQMRRALARTRGSAASAQATATLLSSYFDTTDWSLRSARLSLRVRQIDDRRVQTLKADRAVIGGVSNPIEIETEIDADEPAIDAIGDKKLRRKVKRLLARSRPVRIFGTEVVRTSATLATEAGDIMEVALDTGFVHAGPRRSRLREAEIELKAGDPAALLALVREITGDGPVRPCLLGKADRGYRLLGEPAEAKRAAKSKAPAVAPGMSSSSAMAEICRTVSRQILHNWQMLEQHDDIDATHQLRVGLRRLRAALRIMRAIDDDALRDLDTGARDLGRVVGQLRDLDVLATEIIAPLSTREHVADGIAALKSRVVAVKKARRKEVLAELDLPRYGMLRLELGLLPHIADHLAKANDKQGAGPVEDLARRALHKLLRRVIKRGRNLSELTVEQRHELRKSIKPLRYGLEFFAALYPRAKVKQLLSCAGQLQTTLGYLNDVALAESLQNLDWTRRELQAMQAVGAVIGWHSAMSEQAWSEVETTWKRFERAAKLLD